MSSSMSKSIILVSALLINSFVYAQESDSIYVANSLENVKVTAFEHNRELRNVPAAVNYIKSAFKRFSPLSVVQAVNTSPGVRMEERSPGSYRFNIRGSSLRSPFGVRNVKIYYNDIPYTDPGGISFLNQLGYYNFNSLEIIKGPGSSLYGAGTGGVLLIQSQGNEEIPQVSLDYTGGSYDMHNSHAEISTGTSGSLNSFKYQHQQNEGYRDQSALKRNVYSWNGQFRINEKNLLKTSFLYGDLFYETPGALTLAEYNANPKAARPAGGGFPGAIAAKAAIFQKTFLAGASYDQNISSWLKNKTVLYGMFTELKNPNLRGYEKSSLPHFGGRTVFELLKSTGNAIWHFNIGAEWQGGYSTVDVHKNVNGNPDSLRSSDEINNRQSFLFAQLSIDILNEWTIVAATSINDSKLSFTRFTPGTPGEQNREFNKELAPRFALMKRFKKTSLYAAVAKGFSPPTTSELLPTGGAINLELDAETGINYELGFKGVLKDRLSFDINTFYFELSNTIVLRRTAGGGDFFINAGSTSQKGIELAVNYPLFEKLFPSANSLAWVSYTYHHFEYKEFKPLNSDFSGNQLPGVSPHALSAGFDINFKKGFFGNINYYFGDRIPLNDANSAYADPYHLLGLKFGYELNMPSRFKMRLILGGENLLDQKYSLGNDINGFGGRYYNAAPRRNYFAGISIYLKKKT